MPSDSHILKLITCNEQYHDMETLSMYITTGEYTMILVWPGASMPDAFLVMDMSELE